MKTLVHLGIVVCALLTTIQGLAQEKISERNPELQPIKLPTPKANDALRIISPANNSHFKSMADIKNFSWKLINTRIAKPQYIIEITQVDANQRAAQTYVSKTAKTYVSPKEVLQKTKEASGQYRWVVKELSTGIQSAPAFFSIGACSIDFRISDIEIECSGREDKKQKYTVCFTSNYSSSTGDLTFAGANSNLLVYDQSYTPLPFSMIGPNPTLISQTGNSGTTVDYCFEVSIDPTVVTNIGFGIQGDDLTPGPITCIPGAFASIDRLPECVCNECDNIEIKLDRWNVKQNGVQGNQFIASGFLDVNAPIYGVEFQVQSIRYEARPKNCTDGVSQLEESGVILMPGTSINGTNAIQLANEHVSGSPNTNNNATKNVSYFSNTAINNAIPIELNIGLPGPLPGFDFDCCQMEYEVCLKIKIYYNEDDCKSCAFQHCFKFTNQQKQRK